MDFTVTITVDLTYFC